MPSPSRAIRLAAIPAPSGTPYERATIAPVSKYPADAEPDTQRRGEKQCAPWHIAEDVGLAHVQQEQQWEAERPHRDQCRGHPQGRERDEREQHDDKRQLERSSGPVRQLRERSNWPTTAAGGAHRDRPRTPEVVTRTARFQASPSESHRRARRIRLREHRSGRPGTPSCPGRLSVGVLMPSPSAG